MIKKLLIVLVILAISVVAGCVFALDNYVKVSVIESKITQDFVISKGMHGKSVLGLLEKQGIIRHAKLYYLWLRIFDKRLDVKAGQYKVVGGTKWLDFWGDLVEGKIIYSKVTFVEGTTFSQMRKKIDQLDGIVHKTRDWDDLKILGELGIKYEHPEGLFFPETYTYHAGTTDLDIYRQAYQSLENILEKYWVKRDKKLPYKNAYEALIMASIVEKETGLASEREQIAGVFVRRLNKKMRLQTDPTVIYGIGEKFNGNITRKDLKRHTPYNTYTINGLPPTPISLVSEASISAAFNPDNSKSLYFVSKGDGSHYFSATLKEHNNAVRKYQLKRRKK